MEITGSGFHRSLDVSVSVTSDDDAAVEFGGRRQGRRDGSCDSGDEPEEPRSCRIAVVVALPRAWYFDLDEVCRVCARAHTARTHGVAKQIPHADDAPRRV